MLKSLHYIIAPVDIETGNGYIIGEVVEWSPLQTIANWLLGLFID
jgi:hypothetical protein